MKNQYFVTTCFLKYFYRNGVSFRKYFKELLGTQKLPPDALEAYQNKKLSALIHHAYRTVPFYQDLFRSLKLKPHDIQTKNDLLKLPLLDKKTVQDNYDKMISKRHSRFFGRTAKTSGTTGMPARFLRDYRAINFENAAVWRYWKGVGDTGKKRLSLRGDMIVPAGQDKPPFWRFNPVNKELQMSSYHLSKRNAPYYIEKIIEFQPRILYCGPSMGYLLAKCFQAANVSYQFDFIFTSSESLDSDVKKYIETVFKCRIYDWYGQAERVAAIGECDRGLYHIQEDYSIVELLPAQDSGQLELVGTHLMNYAMPLIRYATGDLINSQHLSSCDCGSPFRSVSKILGRTYGYLLTPEGAHIAITAHIPMEIENILAVQFHQYKPGEVLLKVVKTNSLTEAEKNILIERTAHYTSPSMKITVEEVEDVPRGPNGKFINIVSQLPSEIL